MLAIIILMFGVMSRFIFHIPNFTPVIAIALFAGVYMEKRTALILPIIIFAVSDIYLGFHNTMLFTWGSVVLIALIGMKVKKNKNITNVASSSLLSAVLFFIVTNFGVWLTSGWYAHNINGLIQCYVMAVPFFRITLLSTVVYTFVLFSAYEMISLGIRNTQTERIK